MADENPAYIAAVRKLPCCVCVKFGLIQTSPTKAHHTIFERFSHLRTHDEEAIPLCDCHHQGNRWDTDKTKLAIHNGEESWIEKYGPDTDYIEETQRALAEYMAKEASTPEPCKAKRKKQSAKIQNRGFGDQKRKIQSRKFGT